jgi:hypothetical protein
MRASRIAAEQRVESGYGAKASMKAAGSLIGDFDAVFPGWSNL